MLKFEEVKVGSKIICVDNKTKWGKLTLDKEYEVRGIHRVYRTENEEWLQVCSDTGISWWYYPRHFVLAEDYKSEESDVWTTP